MQTLRVDHPDIEKFISIKTGDIDMIKYSNISVLLTHDFMKAVEDDTNFDLHWNGKTYKTLRARDLWEQIITNAHASATICNPSRTAVWSGVRAGVSGCYDNKDYPWKSFIKEKLGMNYWLQQGGYHTAARGKTYHSSQQGTESDVKMYTDEWDDYPKVKVGDVVKEYTDRMGFTEDIELSRRVRDDDDADWHTVDFCAEKLNEDPAKRDNKPLFLACGFVKVSHSFYTTV